MELGLDQDDIELNQGPLLKTKKAKVISIFIR